MNAMNTKEERNMILSNLKNLEGIPEYKAISVTENYTITERQMIKDWSDKAKGKNKNESLGSKFVWRVRGSPRKWAATQEVPEADTSNRLELSHGKKVFKQLQNIEEADRDKNSKKSLNRDRMIYPLSKNNTNLNNLLKYLSGKKYSRQCFVGDFKFRNINSSTSTIY